MKRTWKSHLIATLTFDQELVQADVSTFDVQLTQTCIDFTRLEIRTRQIQQHTTCRLGTWVVYTVMLTTGPKLEITNCSLKWELYYFPFGPSLLRSLHGLTAVIVYVSLLRQGKDQSAHILHEIKKQEIIPPDVKTSSIHLRQKRYTYDLPRWHKRSFYRDVRSSLFRHIVAHFVVVFRSHPLAS